MTQRTELEYVVKTPESFTTLMSDMQQCASLRRIRIFFGDYTVRHTKMFELFMAFAAIPTLEDIFIRDMHVVNTDYEIPAPRRYPRAKPLDIAFSNCTFDFAALQMVMRVYLKITDVGALLFAHCKFTQINRKEIPDDAPGEFTILRELRMSGVLDYDECTAILGMCKTISIKDLAMDINWPFTAAPDGPRYGDIESLSIYSGSYSSRVPAHYLGIAEIIRAAHKLFSIRLFLDKTLLHPEIAAAIADRQLEKMLFYRGEITDDLLRVMLQPQQNLLELEIYANALPCSAGEIVHDVVANNNRLEVLRVLGCGIMKACSDLIKPAVLASTSILSFEVDTQLPNHFTYGQRYGDRNTPDILRHLFMNQLRTQQKHVQIVSVLVSGPLQDTVASHLDHEYPSASVMVERELKYGMNFLDCIDSISSVDLVELMDIAKRVYVNFLNDRGNAPGYADRRKRRPSRTVLVVYTVDDKTSVDMHNAVRVVTVLPDGVDAFLDSAESRVAGPAPTVVVVKAPLTPAQSARAAALLPGTRVVPMETVRAEVCDAARNPTVRMNDLFYSLAVIRAGQPALTVDEIDLLKEEYEPSAGQDGKPCIWPLRDGGVITRLPAFLQDLWDIFSNPVQRVRAFGRAPRNTKWHEQGWLYNEDAYSVFAFTLGTQRVPMDEALDIMTTFCVLCRIDERRVVYPKVNSMPRVMYRALARLLAEPWIYNQQMQEDGAIHFTAMRDNQSTKMVAAYSDDGVEIFAEDAGPSANILAAELTKILQ